VTFNALNQDETTLLSGPVGDIEILESAPKNALPITAIICHPHPLYGGTMHNKVITTMARAFHELRVKTIRFNFRGVGKSAGAHDNGLGETMDALFLAEWVKESHPHDKIWFAGFSFGAFVAYSATTQWPTTTQLICIAPQVSRFLASKLPLPACPWLIIQGEKDEIVSSDDVFAWIDTVYPKPTVIRFPDVGHFFHGHLLALRKTLMEALKPIV